MFLNIFTVLYHVSCIFDICFYIAMTICTTNVNSAFDCSVARVISIQNTGYNMSEVEIMLPLHLTIILPALSVRTFGLCQKLTYLAIDMLLLL